LRIFEHFTFLSIQDSIARRFIDRKDSIFTTEGTEDEDGDEEDEDEDVNSYRRRR